MFYAYLRGLVVFLLWIINGNAHYHNRDKLLNKDENYILVAPHRTWWDPVYMAFSARPKQFIFMAKKELFKNRIFGWWIRMCGAFPIDRENPGQEAIKYPVNMLKKSNRSLIMFPSGSRHSSDVKGGVAVIAKMAKVKIMPVVYQGPRELKGLLTGERVGIQSEFDRLDEEALSYQTGKKPNPLTYIYRIPLGLVAIIAVILTMAFSYVASFVWDPEKHRAKETQK